MVRSCRSLAWIGAVLAPLACGVEAAQTQTAYPDHPVKIIVPIGPGGSYVQSGQARGIAVLSSKHSPLAPDVPTMSEAGVAGLDVDSWLGIFAPARTPPEIIAKLRGDVRASLPDLKERFEKSGGEVWDMPDEKLDGFVASEHENWTKLIREAGIKLD